MTRFTHPIRVRYSDVDSQGFVFNSRYLEYVDHAVTEWLRAIGLVYSELADRGWDFVLRHAEVDWLLPGRADEMVDVAVERMAIGESSFTLICEVLRQADVLFRMKVIYVSLDPDTGRKMPTPDFVREALGSEG